MIAIALIVAIVSVVVLAANALRNFGSDVDSERWSGQ